MTFPFTVLNFLFLTWVFWPIVLGILLVAFGKIVYSVREHDFAVFPAFLIATTGAAIAYRYPSIRPYFFTWQGVGIVFGAYVVAGFLVSLYKWMAVLIDFKKLDVSSAIAKVRVDEDKEYLRLKQKHGNDYEYTRDVLSEVQGYFSNCVVKESADGKISVYPNWKKHPIGTWWSYWPFFALELPFDFVKQIGERLLSLMRHFYNGIAEKFVAEG